MLDRCAEMSVIANIYYMYSQNLKIGKVIFTAGERFYFCIEPGGTWFLFS